MSVDPSSYDTASENPDHPMSIVYSGKADVKFLTKNKKRLGAGD